MPPKRDQLTEERLNALIEVLVAQGTLPRDWADSLESTRDFGHGREIAAAARAGRGPPDHANNGGENKNDRTDSSTG